MSVKTSIESYTYDYTTQSAIVGKDEGWGPVNYGTNSGSSQNSRTTTPDTIKGWKEKIKRRQGASTTMSGTKYWFGPCGPSEVSVESFSKITSHRTGGTKAVGAISCPPSPEAPNFLFSGTTSADNQALMKYVRKCISAQRSIQGLVALGELGETLRMVRSPLKSLYRGFFDYFKAAEKSARKAARGAGSLTRRKAVKKAVADTYLEYTFGWTPLLSDIDSAAKAAARIVTYRPPSVLVRAGFSIEQLAARTVHSPNLGGLFMTFVYENKAEYSRRFYGSVMNRSGWNGAMQDLGFTWGDFIPTVWELIPYSFVVDYFTNIGDILDAAAFNQATLAWTGTGRKTKWSRNQLGFSFTNPPQESATTRYRIRFSPGAPFSSTRTEIVREPYTGPFIPTLEFTIPGLGTKWINLAALLSQGKTTSRRIAAL